MLKIGLMWLLASTLGQPGMPPGPEPSPKIMAGFSQTISGASTTIGEINELFPGPVYGRTTANVPIRIRDSTLSPPTLEDTSRIFGEFDISSMVVTNEVVSSSIRVTIETLDQVGALADAKMTAITARPTAISDSALFAAFGQQYNSTPFRLDTIGEFQTIKLDRIDGGVALAGADLQAAIDAGQTWFAIGITYATEGSGNISNDAISPATGMKLEFAFVECTDPFSLVDNDVHAALTGFTDLTDLVAADRILSPDRSVNFLELERMMDIHPRIVVLPDFSPMDLQAGSQELIEFRSRYQITVLTNDAHRCNLRAEQYQIFRALLRMKKRLKADGVTTLPKPTPFDYIAPRFTIARLGAEWNQNLDPAKWRGLFEFDVSMTVELADVV